MHRAHAHPGEGNAHGQTATAHEPVGEEERLAGISQAVGATADEHAERGIQVPRLAHHRGQHQPGRHASHADLDHHPRSAAIHEAADQGTQDSRDQKSKGKRPCRHAALPAKLIEDGWEK